MTALILCAALLAGCSGGERIITLLDETASPAYDQAAVENYAGVDEYTPADAIDLAGALMPAPVTDAQKQEAARAAGQDSGAQAAQHNYENADLILGLVAGVETEINPLRCKYRDIMTVNALVYESLVELDETRTPTPLLADRWTVEGSTWTFTLRSGITFHNGERLGAQDVVASYQEIMQNPSTYWQPLLAQAVSSISAADESTIVVQAKGSIGYMLLYAMTFPVVSRGSVQNARPFGTGPYWYISYDAGNALRIEQNPLWWKRANSNIHSIVGILCGTDRIALNLLELGEINALASEYPTVSLSGQLSGRQATDYSTNTYECIIPNLRGPLLGDLAIRQALMYAIDRTTLATTVYAGLVQESEVPVTPGSWIYNAQATRYNYSPERALKILQDAGWRDMDGDALMEKEIDGSLVPLKLELITYDRGTTNTRSEAVELLATQLRMVGFDVSTNVLDSRGVYDRINGGDFDLALCAFELSDIPNLNFMFGMSGEWNFQRYASDEMETLLRDAYSADSAEALKTQMYSLQIKLVEDLPILGLFFRKGLTVSTTALGRLSGPRRGNCLRGLATASG